MFNDSFSARLGDDKSNWLLNEFKPTFSLHVNQAEAPKVTAPEPSRQPNTLPVASRPQANWSFDQHKELRDRSKQQWREELSRQVEEKKLRDRLERERKQQEDQAEEVRLKRELEELQKREQVQLAPQKPEVFVHAVASKRLLAKQQSIQHSSIQQSSVQQSSVQQSSTQHSSAQGPSTQTSYFPERFEREERSYFYEPRRVQQLQIKHDYSVQENALKNIISKLKQEAASFTAENNDVFNEFKKLQEELRTQPTRASSMRIFPTHIAYREPSRQSSTLHSESTFLPLTSAGHSILKPAEGRPPSHHLDLSKSTTQQQIDQLDRLLNQSKFLNK